MTRYTKENPYTSFLTFTPDAGGMSYPGRFLLKVVIPKWRWGYGDHISRDVNALTEPNATVVALPGSSSPDFEPAYTRTHIGVGAKGFSNLKVFYESRGLQSDLIKCAQLATYAAASWMGEGREVAFAPEVTGMLGEVNMGVVQDVVISNERYLRSGAIRPLSVALEVGQRLLGQTAQTHPPSAA